MKQGKIVQVRWAVAIATGLAILVSLRAGFWNKSEPHPNQIPEIKLAKLPKTPIAMINWEEKKTVWYWRSREYGGLQSVLRLQWAEVPTEEDEKMVQPLLIEMAKKQLRIARSEKVFYKPLQQSEDKKSLTVKIQFTSDFPSKWGALRRTTPSWVEFDDGGRYP